VNARWVGLPLVLDELDQVPRREAFKDAWPGTLFEQVGDQYIGSVPYTEQGDPRMIVFRGDCYRAVLDALEEYFSDGADFPPGSEAKLGGDQPGPGG
jgi:hypothetical protein